MAGNNGQLASLAVLTLNQPFGILGGPKSVPDPVILTPVSVIVTPLSRYRYSESMKQLLGYDWIKRQCGEVN